MRQVAFPYPVRMQSVVPILMGLRHDPFQNVNGETFAKPSLNGFWRVNMSVISRTSQGNMALSAFLTAMSATTECVVPICTQWRPNDHNGRPLARGGVAPEYTFDHTGFLDAPFDGFFLAEAANHRDSRLDIVKPTLSPLRAGHFISLGDRLHQVVAASAIDEREDRVRVSIMPNIRGGYPAGELVIVDQLRLRCQMESGDPIGFSTDRPKRSSMVLVESFA